MISGSSIFGQVLSLIDRREFGKIVQKHSGDYRAKGFRCQDLLNSMLFCQIGQACSLSEISCGLRSAGKRLRHLGIMKAPGKSTLSYANAHRPWEIFEELFYKLHGRLSGSFRGKKPFRFKAKLFSLDGSVIDLCGSMFDWCHYQRSKGAVKMHLALDHDANVPVFARVTDAKHSEKAVAKQISLPSGSIVAVDRGYWDFSLFQHWTRQGVFFVTRPRGGFSYDILEEREVPSRSKVVFDRVIQSKGRATERAGLGRTRLVGIQTDKGVMEFLTNNMKLSAQTIGKIYQQRWQIESFFKTLKQNLKIKHFVGTSANALKIQIWTALIAILLLKYLKDRATLKWSLSNLVAMLRWNLLRYTDLWAWLANPEENPAGPPRYVQLGLPGFGLGQQRRATVISES